MLKTDAGQTHVAKITIVDDSTVEAIGVGHDGLEGLLRDHARWATVFGIN